MSTAQPKVRVAVMACLLSAMHGCNNWQTLEFNGGSIGGHLNRPEERFTAVSVDMGTDMAAKTSVELGDNEVISLRDVTPALLLSRGEIYAASVNAEHVDSHRIRGLTACEQSKRYAVYIRTGNGPCGPIYSFDVTDGTVRSMSAGWSTTAACPGQHVRGVFVASDGSRRPLPLSRKGAELLWGPPVGVTEAHVGGL